LGSAEAGEAAADVEVADESGETGEGGGDDAAEAEVVGKAASEDVGMFEAGFDFAGEGMSQPEVAVDAFIEVAVKAAGEFEGEIEVLDELGHAGTDILEAANDVADARVGVVEAANDVADARVGVVEAANDVADARVGVVEAANDVADAGVSVIEVTAVEAAGIDAGAGSHAKPLAALGRSPVMVLMGVVARASASRASSAPPVVSR
jgi:hypothetical protein